MKWHIENDSIMIRLCPRSSSHQVRWKSLENLAFDDLLWVSGEFRDRIDVIEGLLFDVKFMTVYNLENNVVRQCSRRVGWQGIGEDAMQDQNEIDDVNCQKFRR